MYFLPFSPLLSLSPLGEIRDQGLPEIGAALGGEVALPTRGMKHTGIITAARNGGGACT